MNTLCNISKMPEILWIQIFKYCDIRDFISTRASCKKMQTYADAYPDIYERECLRLFTSPLSLFQ